tara:strand:- start:1505 stop:3034 length:1530 start_codon:yes stop_codon:yes gene_type:complete
MKIQKLNKSDLFDYYSCKANLYRIKNEGYEKSPLSIKDKHFMNQGNKFELEARKLFRNGVLVEGADMGERILATKYLLEKKEEVTFQAAVEAEGFIAISDVLKRSPKEDSWELYEIKSGLGLKTENVTLGKPNHIIDLAFQLVVLEMIGLKISKCVLLHSKGNIPYTQEDPNFFKEQDVTEQVDLIKDDVLRDMLEMKYFLSQREIGLGCDCLLKGRSNHCDTFSISNPEVDDYSIHDLKNVGISKANLKELTSKNLYSIDSIPIGHPIITDTRKAQFKSYISKNPVYDIREIDKFVSSLKKPIQFLDFETHSGAIPMIEGYKSWEQIPFQWSLHRITESGDLEHSSFVATSLYEDPMPILTDKLFNTLDHNGTIIVYKESFEKDILSRIMERFPKYSDRASRALNNVIDLLPIFRDHYIDYRTKGSYSLKAVTPVVLGDDTYDHLVINDGIKAGFEWEKMFLSDLDNSEKEKIKQNLLDYCNQDTLATYKLLMFLQNLLVKESMLIKC